MKNSMCLRSHSHRVFSFSVIMSIGVFSVPMERAAVTAGGDLRGLGDATNKHFYCFGNCVETVKIGKLVQVCIACEFANLYEIFKVVLYSVYEIKRKDERIWI